MHSRLCRLWEKNLFLYTFMLLDFLVFVDWSPYSLYWLPSESSQISWRATTVNWMPLCFFPWFLTYELFSPSSGMFSKGSYQYTGQVRYFYVSFCALNCIFKSFFAIQGNLLVSSRLREKMSYHIVLPLLQLVSRSKECTRSKCPLYNDTCELLVIIWSVFYYWHSA